VSRVTETDVAGHDVLGAKHARHVADALAPGAQDLRLLDGDQRLRQCISNAREDAIDALRRVDPFDNERQHTAVQDPALVNGARGAEPFDGTKHRGAGCVLAPEERDHLARPRLGVAIRDLLEVDPDAFGLTL
jgi:hypothetical protein